MDSEFESLKTRFPILESVLPQIQRIADQVLKTFQHGSKLLLAGNGGSAADCDHISGELLKRFEAPRPIEPALAKQLGEELATALEAGLPVIPLPNFSALITAWSNDRDADYTYAQLVLALGRTGDTLLCLTTSGTSANLIHAARTARAMGVAVVALSGRGGGDLAGLCDLHADIPGDSSGSVQELHLPVYHALCRFWEKSAFPLQQPTPSTTL